MKPIKLHKPLLQTVQKGLENIFADSYADKEVQKILRTNKQFGSKDRSFIAETIYDIVRWKRNYEIIIKGLQIPDANWQAFIFVSLLRRQYDLLNPEIFEIDIDTLNDNDQLDLPLNDSRISFPEWLDQRCYNELDEAWNEIASSLNIPARIFIRANTLKTTAEKLLTLIKKEGIDAVIPFSSMNPERAIKTCIEILSKNNLRNSGLYKSGLLEFQDLGSQAIGQFCEVKTGQTVLDLCAGAGGKTLQLSALLNNTGKIYATDKNQARLENLEKRTQQAGCGNIKVINYDEVKTLKDIDVLLIDAPCSGLGTIKRHPDTKWKLKNEDIEQYIGIQSSLLQENKSIIRTSGKIIYATCSILPSEGEDQIKNFLRKNSEYILKKELRIHPHLHGCDGFYMAEILRK
ncbi:MAG: methyltransferase [Bacteroidota bacterium]|nr:methyltransferase [Bacteroidota bacterium]